MPYTYDHGSGTSGDPYQVWTANDLNGVRDHLSAYFIQMSNIDISGIANWLPIGAKETPEPNWWNTPDPFNGNYDGGAHVIYGITINNGGQWYSGLFAVLGTGAVVTRLGFDNVNIYEEGTFATAYGGVICGWNYGTISRCFARGSVSIAYAAGGLSPVVHGGSIENSYFGGSVHIIYPGGYAGGLVGADDAGSTVHHCYAYATVTGDDVAGGLMAYSTETVVNSYYNSELTAYSAAGDPRSTAEMTYPPASNTYAGWDFATIWLHDTEYTINSGYPYLFGDAAFAVHSKITAAWKSGPAWIKKDGQWKSVTAGWIKEGGTWKPIVP